MIQTNSTRSFSQEVSAQQSSQINRTLAGIQTLGLRMMQQIAKSCAAAGFKSALPNRSRNRVGGNQDVEQIPFLQTALMLRGQPKPVVEMSYSIRTFRCWALNPGKMAQIQIQVDSKADPYYYRTNSLFLIQIIKQRAPSFPTPGSFMATTITRLGKLAALALGSPERCRWHQVPVTRHFSPFVRRKMGNLPTGTTFHLSKE